MDGRYYPYVEHGGPHLVAWLIFAVLLALLALAVVYALTQMSRGWPVPPRAIAPAPAGDDPLAVLRLRYARGEVTREEFLQGCEDLTAPPQPPPAPAG